LERHRQVSATLRSLARERPAILVVLVWLWVALAPWARAAPAFEPPSGWDEGEAADAQARRRAEAWAKAWSADVRRVMSTRADDGFTETLAILDAAAPIPIEALADLDAGRTWLEPRVTAALGAKATLDPDGLELRPRPGPGVAVLVARVQLDDRVARVAVAPRGARHLAVVLLVPQAEEVLYGRVFDDAIDSLDGLQRPVAPFPRGSWRLVALLVWLGVGGVLAVAWIRRSLPQLGARAAGRRATVALLGASVLVLVLAGALLGDAAVELSLAGSSPWGFAVELSMGGAIVAMIALVTTEVLERRFQPIASAPQSGSFAVIPVASRRAASSLTAAVTGDTHVGPPPAVTGDTHVGPPPAVTGDTHVGPPPAVTGNTKVGPPPQPISIEGFEAGPPVREIISGDIEVQTQVRRMPEPDTVRTSPPVPPGTPVYDPSADEDTNPRAIPGTPDGVASLAGPPEPSPRLDPGGRRLPKLEIDWS
jgi:hypothetical protein